jgi:hypothetical protein
MKAQSFLSLIGLVATVAFSSCSKDETTPAKPAPVATVSYTAKLLAAPLAGDTASSSTRAVFFSSSNGATLNFANAKAGSATVDFGYFFGGTTSAVLASPDDYLTTVNNNYVSRFGTKNATRFKTLTSASFSAIARNGQIDTAWNEGTLTPSSSSGIGVAGSRAIQLQVNNVLVAQFASGKKAILVIKDVQTGTGASGSITFDIKVQG